MIVPWLKLKYDLNSGVWLRSCRELVVPCPFWYFFLFYSVFKIYANYVIKFDSSDSPKDFSVSVCIYVYVGWGVGDEGGAKRARKVCVWGGGGGEGAMIQH